MTGETLSAWEGLLLLVALIYRELQADECPFPLMPAGSLRVVARSVAQIERQLLPVPVMSLVEFPVDASVDNGRDVFVLARCGHRTFGIWLRR